MARLNVKSIKLKDELGNFLALITAQREQLTEQVANGEPINMRAMVDLTKCFEAATRSKIALDRADQKREDSLSPEEELEEVKNYLMSFDHKERLAILEDIIKRHNITVVKANKKFLTVRSADPGI
jgi:hypothetical protein